MSITKAEKLKIYKNCMIKLNFHFLFFFTSTSKRNLFISISQFLRKLPIKYDTFYKYFLIWSQNTSFQNSNSNGSNGSKNFFELINEFYHLWPLHQWVSSLIGLILLYWVTGHYYNKWLSNKGGWLDWNMRIWLIISDLTINLILGLYYLNHRETALGLMMLKCPIAISPVIFLLELICFYMYYRFVKKKTSNFKNFEKKNNK